MEFYCSKNEYVTKVNYKKLLTYSAFAAILTGSAALTACNEKSDSDPYLNPVNLAVKTFSLKADYNNPGLDSVFFSIDLEHGVIFNADSLRKGTAIDKVIPLITFSSTPSEATIIMSGGTTREGEVDFKENPTDSIDFTGDVQLRVKASKNEIGMTYRIKVNVHQIETDSIFWDEVSYTGAISRLDNPKDMKTVEIGDMPVSVIAERDGSYSVVRYESVIDMKASVAELKLPFEPALQTLCATDDSVWILDTKGELWQADTALTKWSSTGETWTALIGTYNSSAIGLKKSGSSSLYAQYPKENLNETEVAEGFPTSGFSNFVTLANKWTSSPVAFFAGGVNTDGTFSDSTWAFDGTEWICLSTGGIPAVEGPTLVPYYHYRPSADGTSMIEYKVWLLLGGKMADGEFNRDLYISYDNGVNWTLGTQRMQLPEIMPSLYYCDNVVVEIDKSADLSAGWTKAYRHPRRIDFSVSGDEITWECPYIYLFGGFNADNKLNSTIWRGVLGRLTFTPII